MREYEVTLIVQPQLEETPRNELIERVNGWLTFGEDEADKPVAKHWGRRRLAYPIKKFTEGYYLHYEAKLDPSQISYLERNFQYADDILRYLVVHKIGS
jgi:small subunit ribosomal protein S6